MSRPIRLCDEASWASVSRPGATAAVRQVWVLPNPVRTGVEKDCGDLAPWANK